MNPAPSYRVTVSASQTVLGANGETVTRLIPGETVSVNFPEEAPSHREWAAPDGLTAAPWESLGWLARYAANGSDPARDVAAYTDPWPACSAPSRPLHGWIHVAVMGPWRTILGELLSMAARSGLAASSSVSLCVVGDHDQAEDFSWLPAWARVVKRDGNIHDGENSTLEALRAWSDDNRDSLIWYVHTKGASRADSPQYPNVIAWRDYLAFFNLLRWRDCVSALGGGQLDAVGVDLSPLEVDDRWRAVWGDRLPRGRAFQGNYWWVTGDYLSRLPFRSARPGADRWWAEYDFLSPGKMRAIGLHHSYVNPYETRIARSSYDPCELAKRAAKPRIRLGEKPPDPAPGRR